MALKQINAYPAASTIDAINDQLLIDPGGTGIYNKINRNVLLGITGAPIGTTDSQTLSNKTIGNTNAITVKDGSFTLNNSSDTTKVGVFSLANVTTSTTRTYTLPNASVTLASLTGTETLTNKTITSPTITGGTIDNTTITVDSIAGHTSGTVVTVANLQISNGVLNSANAVTATSIAAGAVQPQALITGTGTGWSFSTWSPTYANLTVGNGTVVSKYIQVGKAVFYYFRFSLGSTSTVGSNPTITLPVTANSSYTGNDMIGQGFVNTSTLNGLMWAQLSSTTVMQLVTFLATGTYPQTQTAFTASIPGTWGTGNSMTFQGFYEAA